MELLEQLLDRSEDIYATEDDWDEESPAVADKMAIMFQALCEQIELRDKRIDKLERAMKKLVGLRDGLLD